MPIQRWTSVFLVAVTCGITGCPTTATKDEDAGVGGRGNGVCLTDGDCSGGFRCMDSQCVDVNHAGCVANDDCAAGQHCEASVCVGGVACTADADCGVGEICPQGGLCAPGCRSTDACADGLVCQGTQCVPCTDNSQCLSGKVCQSGHCTAGCSANTDCTNGQVCVGGNCGACTTASQCGAGSDCTNGGCVPRPSCTTDSNCSTTQVCVAGHCDPLPTCTTTADCASANQSCLFGTCTRNDGCTTTADCSATQTCTAGQCVNNPACSSQAQCTSTQTCSAGTCTNNPACQDNTSCMPTQHCQGGTCTGNNTCTTNDQCTADETCAGGVCTRNGSCSRDLDCPVDQSCLNGSCHRNNACTQESQCTTAQACTGGVCVRNPTCGQDSDCLPVQSCVAGICTDNGTCTRHADCPASQYCQGSTCVQGPQCTTDVDCADSQHCAAGRCEVNTTCTTNLDCPREQNCSSNTCVRNPICDSRTPCAAGFACYQGGCVQIRNCAQNSDCQDNTVCNGVETCDVAGGGLCVAGTPVSTSDGVSCTDDLCDPVTGAVTHVARNALCNDNNVCTLDVCSAVLGCSHDADPAAVPAQVPGDCKRQVCQGTAATTVVDNLDVPVADGFACTVEECVNGVPGTRANNAACGDNNQCNGVERCVVGQGCQPAASPLNCPNPDSCHVGFCDALTGCGSRLVDVDGDGHAPVSCGGDDCNDRAAGVHPGATEVAGDGVDNNCNGFIDEGFGTLSCPTPPVGKRILDTISLTAQVTGAPAGSYSVRWTVTVEPVANSLALQGANTSTVTFVPVIRGNYTLRARLTQTTAADQTCDVAFLVDGPDEDFNAQLVMKDGVDVDLHLLHPEGMANHTLVDFINNQASNAFYYEFNWGPAYNFAWYQSLNTYSTDLTEEAIRVMPDCHWGNCTACTVTVPGQPACTNTPLPWNTSFVTAGQTLYPFVNSATNVPATANPKLDIDNRRGCYTDALGNRVCTPENISIKTPGPRTGVYTVAVHYWGEPIVQSGTTFTGNQRGVAPAGLTRVTTDVEIYCKGQGFKKFRCNSLPIDGWCFVANVTWSGTTNQCTSISAVPLNTNTTARAFPHALLDGEASNIPPQWDTSTSFDNIVAAPIP